MPAPGYPIILDMTQRLAVIVGGGRVALRKAQVLLASGAGRIRVVAPAIDLEMPQAVQRVQQPYRAEHLAGATLVFAATDSPQVNEQVVRDAHAIGALVNRADVDEQSDAAGDFATPALVRDGPVLVTVSTGGSPALAALARDRIAAAIDPRWARMAEAMQALRPMIRRAAAPQRRGEIFRRLASDEAISELGRAGLEGLRVWLAGQFPELKTAKAPRRAG